MARKQRPQLQVGDLTFGGERYLMCVPLTAQSADDLLCDTRSSLQFAPDLFEWRVDGFSAYPDPKAVLSTLQELRQAAGDRPILFTPRHIDEGGMYDITDADKFRLIEAVSQSGLIDLIDIEMRYGQDCLTKWSATFKKRNVKLVISHHDFNQYIPPEEVISLLKKQQEWGADICKLITKIGSCKDLVDYSDALFTARQDFLAVPLIAGAMGDASPLMRVFGDFLGSDMTFATAAGSPSHPTQIHIQQMRTLRNLVLEPR